jgi:MFS family permease
LPFYYGWIAVVLAAIAMTATFPGRTHGLGLIAKPLELDSTLQLDEETFARLNFGAILLGSLFCLPVGWLIDKIGVRGVLVGVCLGLGGAVLWMSAVTDRVMFFLSLTAVRGFGQGALSVVSMAMIGKWFTRRLPVAMGVFTVLLSIGFIATTVGVGMAVKDHNWRVVWAGIGYSLLGFALVGGLLMRSTPESIGLPVEEPAQDAPSTQDDWTLSQALRLPAFWAFALSAALFNLTWSAITLNNERLMEWRGFNHDTFVMVMALLVFAGLPANLLCGWLAGRWPMGRLSLVGMIVFALSLFAFPLLTTQEHAIGYGLALGFSGGVVTVIFFAVYGKAFGRTHLGLIQGAAQVITVIASALGPWLLALCKNATGSYSEFFTATAPLALVLGLAAWLLPLPRERGTA